MPFYTKESLDNLRNRVDLVEVLSSHLELKRSGASYKGLCPFHDEKTPSFVVQKGDSHYHCFGCGAHGDSIQFLMSHQKMEFYQAVESLAQKFQVHLETVKEGGEEKGPPKAALKEALGHAARFYHLLLLRSEEGREALRYLYQRGIDLDFIRHFQLGLSPRQTGLFRTAMHGKFLKDEILLEAGLLRTQNERGYRDFFSDRIMFPIHDPSGSVIGFSARKYKEETFGGKYVNSPETPLFKKSRLLFGLHHCRRRIAKERKVVIVEGQIDALRLIQEGVTITVAGQGTAFGESHMKELTQLGIDTAYLALDADEAGKEAAVKIGNLFQSEGVEARILELPPGGDPDSLIREEGPEAFLHLMEQSVDYLTFLVKQKSSKMPIGTPAGKSSLVQEVGAQIREWNNPLMVFESLRKLAHLVQVPEGMVVEESHPTRNIYIKRQASIGQETVDPDQIIESDFLRWLLLMGDGNPKLVELAKKNITSEMLHIGVCAKLYQTYLDLAENNSPRDWLNLISNINDAEAQLLLSGILKKIVNREKTLEHFIESMQKILDRNWMEAREEIKRRIQSGQCTDEEAMELAREFDDLRRNQPKVITE